MAEQQAAEVSDTSGWWEVLTAVLAASRMHGSDSVQSRLLLLLLLQKDRHYTEATELLLRVEQADRQTDSHYMNPCAPLCCRCLSSHM